MQVEETVPPNNYGQRSSGAVKIAEDQALRFLEFIFQGLTRGYVEFRHLGEGRRPKIIGKPLYLPLPLDHSQVTDEVLTATDSRMISVGLVPRYRIPQGGKSAKDHDVIQAGCIWAELNYGRIEGGAIGVSRLIREFPLRPSITVNSGHGRQVYFVFDQPLSDGRLLDWDDLIRGLCHVLTGSEAINLAQTFLLPGIFDLKNSESVLLSSLDDGDSSWVRYSFEELKEAIQKGAGLKQAKSEQHHSGKSLLSISTSALKERGVSPDVINTIITGRSSHTDNKSFVVTRDYHERDLWISMCLLDCGFDQEEIKSIFRSNPQGCGRRFAREKNSERYLEFTVRTAAALRRRRGEGDDFDDDVEGALLPPDYELDPDGSLWYKPDTRDSGRKMPKPVKVSNSYMCITGIQENIDDGLISLIIQYEYLGQARRKVITRSQMSDPRQLLAMLAGSGAPVTSNNARHVTSYLAAFEHAFGATLPSRKVISRFGWETPGSIFFLPGAVSEVDFMPAKDGDAALFRAYASRRGTLRGWLHLTRTIAEEGLMIPQVAILTCFVPPLQGKLRIPNFILDINGGTSTGKSTSLKLAASVYGSFIDPDSMVMQWMNTKVAVEQLASLCSDLPIFLDDAQHCQDELKRSVIYMIANGKGKGRAARGGGLDEVTTWHTVALSTSEEPLHESSPHEGARGRILPVGGATNPFPLGSSSLVQSLERAAALNHGFAGEAFVRHISNWTDSDWSRWHRRYLEICKELLMGSSSNVVGRVSGYIAAIQTGAEIACPLLGIPFKPDVIGAWLMLHLAEEQSRQNLVLLALRALADFYLANVSHFAGDGLYRKEKQLTLHGMARRYHYVGFLRSTLEMIFRTRKWNQTTMLNKMAEAGVVHTTEGDRHTKKVTFEGIKHRMVCVKWSALFPGDITGPEQI
ncbi:MAG TPA: DUF927 domain-containing protein [Pyrinomonadaceae bacterium]|jgi:hypothetical protein